MKRYFNKTFGSALLVAGTAIGAGMLALPIATGIIGFWYSFLLFAVSFIFMLTSLFLLLEVNLWSEKITANIITMAKERLGMWGQIVAWLSFLLLLYSVASAYLSGGGSLISKLLSSGENRYVSEVLGIFIFMFVFGFIVVFETRFVDAINRILMIGLIGGFILFFFLAIGHIDPARFEHGDPKFIFSAVPIVVLSFTSHIIVPNLRTYLSGNVKKLKRALFFGSLIPLVFYLVYEFIIFGIIPIHGPNGLAMIAKSDYPVAVLTTSLHAILKAPSIPIVVGCFSFFALVTSFLGVSLSLYEFLADGLSIRKTILGRMLLLALMFGPPVLFAVYFPSGFLLAISYAGVFVAILYGILPVLMVWQGRYKAHIKEKYTVPGGKTLLVVMFLGSCAVIFFQIAAVQKLVPSP